MAYSANSFKWDSTPYDAMRKRVRTDLNSQRQVQGQEQQDALQRRFASQGLLNSGAAIKQQQISQEKLDEQYNQNLNRSLGDIDINEAQQRNERQFQFDEGERARGFAAGESEKQRIQTRELFDLDLGFKQQLRADENKWKELDNKFRERDFAETLKVNRINALNALTSSFDFDDGDIREGKLDAMARRFGI